MNPTPRTPEMSSIFKPKSRRWGWQDWFVLVLTAVMTAALTVAFSTGLPHSWLARLLALLDIVVVGSLWRMLRNAWVGR